MRQGTCAPAVAVALAFVAGGALARANPERGDVHIAVGGHASFYYLPLTIAEGLGTSSMKA